MNLVCSDSLAFEVGLGRKNYNNTLMYNVGHIMHIYTESSMSSIAMNIPKCIRIRSTVLPKIVQRETPIAPEKFREHLNGYLLNFCGVRNLRSSLRATTFPPLK